MEKQPPGAWSLVLIPAVITLFVTILRTVGELQGWNDDFFSNVAPGGEQKPGWVGISWLILVFGIWFGIRLRRATGEPASAPKSALLFLLAIGVMIGGIWGFAQLGLIVFPSKDNPVEASGLPWALLVVGVALLVGLAAWFRLGRVLLLYGILARIPVIVVTWLAVQGNWNTHYNKLPAGTPPMEGTDLFFYLAMPQATFWPVVTVLGGGLIGSLAAGVVRRRG